MGRKTFGVFFGGNDDEFQGMIADGIRFAGQKYDANILEFVGLMNKPALNEKDVISPVIIDGESEIFRLPDFNLFDGIILIDNTFLNPSVGDKIVNKGISRNIPVAVIDGHRDGCYNVNFDDMTGIGSMMEHIIVEHKCKKINFIAGFREGSIQSDERLNSYIEALNRHGIPVEQDRIGYGEFRDEAAKVMAEFLEKDVPDAVVCASDVMALAVINELVSRGYRVPEEIIVTGFDGISDGQNHFPSLTSVGRSKEEVGEAAVKLLIDHCAGLDPETTTYIRPKLIINQSCGCHSADYLDICRNYSAKNTKIKIYHDFIYDLATMSSEMVAGQGIPDLVNTMINHIEIFNFRDILFNFCEQVAGQNENDDEKDGTPSYKGYSENMYYMGKDHKGKFRSGNFNVKHLVPKMDLEAENPVFYLFIPMYFLDRTLGYISVTMDESTKRLTNLLYTFVRSASNAIGEYCMKGEMESMVKQLDRMYVRDALTTLYNRRGLQRYAQVLMSSAKAFGAKVMGIGIDMDDLKKINDNYGHQEGDIAIKAVGDAIRKASVNGEVCSRTGGDEFFVVGNCDGIEDATRLIEQIEENLRVYNEHHDNPYLIGCSCGAFVMESGNDYTLETLMKIADSRMYIVKANRKAQKSASVSTDRASDIV